MSARGIVIKDCGHCPRHDHRGAFGEVAYVPQCHAVLVQENGIQRARVLPHTVERQGPGGSWPGRLVAVPAPGIPEWCPLPMVEVLS